MPTAPRRTARRAARPRTARPRTARPRRAPQVSFRGLRARGGSRLPLARQGGAPIPERARVADPWRPRGHRRDPGRATGAPRRDGLDARRSCGWPSVGSTRVVTVNLAVGGVGWGCVEGHPLGVGMAFDGGVLRRCPTLPPRCRGSTIGAGGLSFRVRYGTGRFPAAVTAVTLSGWPVCRPRFGGVRSLPGNRTVDACWCVVKSSAY
jgi:hypothetical protein